MFLCITETNLQLGRQAGAVMWEIFVLNYLSTKIISYFPFPKQSEFTLNQITFLIYNVHVLKQLHMTEFFWGGFVFSMYSNLVFISIIINISESLGTIGIDCINNIATLRINFFVKLSCTILFWLLYKCKIIIFFILETGFDCSAERFQ